MTLEEADPPVEVWPAAVPAVNVFGAMVSQWRNGFNGPTGLDYSVLRDVMKLVGIPKRDRKEVFAHVRTMEAEALRVISEARDRKGNT